jgi:hypothetical protein
MSATAASNKDLETNFERCMARPIRPVIDWMTDTTSANLDI